VSISLYFGPRVAEMLDEFHRALGQPFGHAESDNLAIRRRLHNEESQELLDALDSGDYVAIARELADVVYVAYGTAHTLGIPLDKVIEEVHLANLSKFDSKGKPLLDGGKVLKGPNFCPPDVERVLDEEYSYRLGMETDSE
jgi:predicted HAD superfamily Cof-like phosphohydrolase